jgi:hypothetical protein
VQQKVKICFVLVGNRGGDKGEHKRAFVQKKYTTLVSVTEK